MEGQEASVRTRMKKQEASVSTRMEEQANYVSIIVEENSSEKVDNKSTVKLQFRGGQTETRVKLEVKEADDYLGYRENYLDYRDRKKQKETDKLDAPPPPDVPPRPDIPPLPVGIAEHLRLPVDETSPEYYLMRKPSNDPCCPHRLCACDPELSEVLCCCCEFSRKPGNGLTITCLTTTDDYRGSGPLRVLGLILFWLLCAPCFLCIIYCYKCCYGSFLLCVWLCCGNHTYDDYA